MADNCAVELLLSGNGLAHLEEHAGVRAVRHRLIAEAAHLTGALEHIVGLPVLLVGRLLRQHKALSALKAAHDIMLEGDEAGLIVRPGIVVPADHVKVFGEGKLIELLDVAGHVGLHRNIRVIALEHAVLVHEAFGCRVGDKAHVIQLDGGAEAIIVVGFVGHGHLFKAGNLPPPEAGVPAAVQFLHRAVAPA